MQESVTDLCNTAINMFRKQHHKLPEQLELGTEEYKALRAELIAKCLWPAEEPESDALMTVAGVPVKSGILTGISAVG